MKMKDKIALMAASSAAGETAAAPPPPRPQTAGSVKAVGLHLTALEAEAERLRALLAAGAEVVELDPSSVRPSPFADRMDDDGPEAFATLKASIEESGQQVPILVRPAEGAPGRYEAAYGHRRLRAAAALGRPVRAVVRPLSDDELVLAQGVENSARQDLTWIEQAMFARRLADRGQMQKTVAAALSVGPAVVSRMLLVSRSLPYPVVAAIGRAPKIGRPRWEALMTALKGGVPEGLAALLASGALNALPSDARFQKVMEVVRTRPEREEAAERDILSVRGRRIAAFQAGRRAASMRFEDPDFATWLADRVPGLHAEFASTAFASADAPRGGRRSLSAARRGGGDDTKE